MSEAIDSSSSVPSLSDLELRTELTRHGIEVGPIVPSTRKIYEKKLQNLRSGNGIVVNDESLTNGTVIEGEIMNAESNELTPRSTPAPNDQGSDDDDEPSESARVLTPREMRNFQRSFMSTDSPNSVVRHRREYSPQLEGNSLFVSNGSQNQKLEKKRSFAFKRFGFSFLVITMTSAFIMAMFWMREHIAPIFDSAAERKGYGELEQDF